MNEAKKPLKLISFLGVQDYSETTYEWQGLSKTTKFTTVACVEFLQPSEVIVFLTKDAETKNFAALEAELTSVPFKKIIVPLGQDQDELWKIFNTLNDAVADGETIAMDVTNGQRSLPMLALLTAAFMKTARDISVKHLLYGAFDVGKSLGAQTTPMFDLSEMLNLLDWSVAADRFIRSGDSADMADLLKAFSEQVKKDGAYSDEAIKKANPFTGAATSLNRVTNSLFFFRPYSAMREIHSLNKYLGRIIGLGKTENRMSPLYRLLEKIDQSYLSMGNSTPESGGADEIAKTLEQERKLIFWYRDHGHWMQSVSLAREWLVSWFMYRAGELDLIDRDLRKHYEEEINCFTKDSLGSKPLWRTNNFIGSFMDGKTFHDLWTEVRDIRNDIAHAGKNVDFNEANALEKRIKKQFVTIENMIVAA